MRKQNYEVSESANKNVVIFLTAIAVISIAVCYLTGSL